MNNNQAERAFGEHHQNARHIYTNLITWWTYWTLINFATMGWLAIGVPTKASNVLRLIVTLVFLAQNVLALFVCSYARRALKREDELTRHALKYLGGQEDADGSAGSLTENLGTIPFLLYWKTIMLMRITLVLFNVLWLSCALILAYRLVVK